MRPIRFVAATLAIATATVWVSAAGQQGQSATPGYLLPPKAIVDILDAAPPPTTDLSPTRDTLALIERASMPSLSELAQPVHATGRPAHQPAHQRSASRAAVALDHAEVDRRRQRTKVTVPPNPALTWLGFSPDGKRFAFTQQRDNGIEFWVGDSATGQAKSVTRRN